MGQLFLTLFFKLQSIESSQTDAKDAKCGAPQSRRITLYILVIVIFFSSIVYVMCKLYYFSVVQFVFVLILHQVHNGFQANWYFFF